MNTINKPYLSVVVTTRNDNHGGDLLARTQAFVNGLLYQCKKHQLHSELIIVEWNPPADKPPLKEVLPSPQKDDFLRIRYIIVPSEIHRKYLMSDKIPLFQMTAKNVGIRRAKGEFVLCTNIDILFSDGCFERIAKQDFDGKFFYRANRIDVDNGLLQLTSVSDQLAYAEKNQIKRLGRNRHLQHVRGIPSFFFGFPRLMKILDLPWGWVDKLVQGKAYELYQLDTMACGDFTLMHKNAWMKIDGYVELDMYSIHIDSMALYAAHLAGLRQEIFEWYENVYHIHHTDGWETITDAKTMLRFLAQKPGLDWWLVVQATLQMKREDITRYELNKPEWGFANETFEEYVLEPNQ